MNLRKGKTKTLLQNSIESALLAVETYNSPRANFKVESFITLMIIAWNRLFHAYFYATIGDRYYYKESNGRYKIVDGEKKAWELKTSIKEYGKLSDPIKSNLEFFVKLRNKIEHHFIEKNEIGVIIFGECQSLLYNYENLLVELFGDEYAINDSLAFSLQFSKIKTKEQLLANKKALSYEIIKLKSFIEEYRSSLDSSIFDSQEYSIKLIQIPKVSNTTRNDLAIEFINWRDLSPEDKEHFHKLLAIVKNKTIKYEAINHGKLPLKEVRRIVCTKHYWFNSYDNNCLAFIFGVKSQKGDDPFETNTKYCHYDEPHNDYIYQDAWPNFIIKLFDSNALPREVFREKFRLKEKLDISLYE